MFIFRWDRALISLLFKGYVNYRLSPKTSAYDFQNMQTEQSYRININDFIYFKCFCQHFTYLFYYLAKISFHQP